MPASELDLDFSDTSSCSTDVTTESDSEEELESGPVTYNRQRPGGGMTTQRLSGASNRDLSSARSANSARSDVSSKSNEHVPLYRRESLFGSMAQIKAAHQHSRDNTGPTNFRERARQAQSPNRSMSPAGKSEGSPDSPRSPRSPRGPPTKQAALARAKHSDANNSTYASMNGNTMRIAATTTSTARNDPDRPVNGTLKLRKIVAQVQDARSAIKSTAAEDIGDAQFAEMKAARKKLEEIKERAAAAICAIGVKISIEAFEVKRNASDLMESIFRETDHKDGNAALLAALSRIVTLDLANTAVAQGWALQCVREGCAQYLDMLLSLPEVRETFSEVDNAVTFIKAANKNNLYRGRLFYVIAKHAKAIPGFMVHKQQLQKFWQAAFDELSTKPRAQNDDTDVRRVDAMEKMVSTPCITVDFMQEDPADRQTIFSRLARDGEAALLHKILSEMGTGVVDINRVQKDGSTALMQAVVANEVKVVAFLCKQPHIDLFKSHPTHGDAIRVAVKNNKDPRIVNILRERAKEIREAGGDTGEADPDFLLSADELKAKAAKKKAMASVVDGTNILKPMLQGALPLFEHFQRLLDENANPVVIREQGNNLSHTKQNLLQKMQSISDHIRLQETQMRQMYAIANLLVKATDRRSGNVDLLQGIFHHIEGIHWAKMCVRSDWLLIAAHDTCHQYLEMLLGLPELSEVLPTDHCLALLKSCCLNRTLRIPLVLILLKFEDVLRVDLRREEFRELLQPFFVEVCCNKRAIVREDRNGRMELLKKLVNHQYILLDPELEETNGDKMTAFARACAEGDTELVQLLTETRTGNHVRDVNRPLPDGYTPLLHAVAGNHTATVQWLLKKGAKAGAKTSHGNALDVAMKLKRDPLLISLLQEQLGLSPLSLSGGGQNASPPPSGASSARSVGGMSRSRDMGDYSFASSGSGQPGTTPRQHTQVYVE